MVVFKVNVTYFALNSVDAKGQTPVAGNVQAPVALSMTFQRVSFPHLNGLKFIRVFHILQKSQHLAELVHGVRIQAFGVVLKIKLFQAFVNEVSYFQSYLTVA